MARNERGRGVVREVAMSSLMRVVASFPPTSLKPLWTTTWKGDKKSKGLGEVLRDVAGEHASSAVAGTA